jgi:heptosyltransferase-1
LVKTSSLGDVVHQLPAVTDARRHRPDAHIAWVVEQDYAPIVRLHPGVDAVIAVATRRWRGHPLAAATWHEIRAFARSLRARHYDTIIDSQGLIRSALITRAARGQRHGYDRADCREPLAACAYDVTHRVPRSLHAIARNRSLTGLALGYAPEGAVDYGLPLAPAPSDPPYVVFLHATARADKEWPEQDWIALGAAVARRGLAVVLPFGNARERARSERLAASIPGARVPPLQPLDQVAASLREAALVVGVDTGLLHLAAALGVPLLALFVATRLDRTGPLGSGPIRSIDGGSLDAARAALAALLAQI